jgi:hypothetical protein
VFYVCVLCCCRVVRLCSRYMKFPSPCCCFKNQSIPCSFFHVLIPSLCPLFHPRPSKKSLLLFIRRVGIFSALEEQGVFSSIQASFSLSLSLFHNTHNTKTSFHFALFLIMSYRRFFSSSLFRFLPLVFTFFSSPSFKSDEIQSSLFFRKDCCSSL